VPVVIGVSGDSGEGSRFRTRSFFTENQRENRPNSGWMGPFRTRAGPFLAAVDSGSRKRKSACGLAEKGVLGIDLALAALGR